MIYTDILIVGGGIAGATLGAELAPHAQVALIEAEDVAGYHATGRSAAFWSETYGGPGIQPLTSASAEFLRSGGFLIDMGALHIGRASEGAAIDALVADFAATDVELRRVEPRTLVPGLRDEWTLGVLEPSCSYIEVAALHADALARLRHAGGRVLLGTPLVGATRTDGRWHVETAGDAISADVVVDAAGAWADEVARLAGARPIGIQALRRTMAQIRTEPAAPEGMPLVNHILGEFYFKPEAGRLWLTPHDETPVDPSDVQPEEIDIAVAIDRFEQVVDWRVAAVERRWAGLRSFAPDRLPVYGFDSDTPGLFWFAGQGGFGIQTAPAAARLASALLLGAAPHPSVAAIDPVIYAPHRLRASLD